MLIPLLEKIVELHNNPIWNSNPNGPDWNSCRFCGAWADDIQGNSQPIEHEVDCPGVVAQELLSNSKENC